MKKVYAYIRVSDPKQMQGASIQEQLRQIKNYAQKRNFEIIKLYQENKTAANPGRPFFDEMIKNLQKDKADGVIIHKIDRCSRNFHDWGTICDIVDIYHKGVYFAQEDIDMTVPAGRIAADFHIVIATNFIRNHKTEVKKGISGRLEQGFLPFSAPVGYLNQGGGIKKSIDPVKAPLIQKLFELYTKEGYNVRQIVQKMNELGLKNSRGNKIPKNGVLRILKNPFYIGLISIKGKSYKGLHTPIIKTRMFKRAQDIMAGKTNTRVIKHKLLFRKLLTCANCKYKLIGEVQKGRTYYRCQTKECPTKTIREDTLDIYIHNLLGAIHLTDKEVDKMETLLAESQKEWLDTQKGLITSLVARIGLKQKRIDSLLEHLLDGTISKEQFEIQNKKTLTEKQVLIEQKNEIELKKDNFLAQLSNSLELAKSLILLYDSANYDEKRKLLEIVTSNRFVDGKKVMFSTASPFYELANRDILKFGGPNNPTALDSECTISYVDIKTSPVFPRPLVGKKLRNLYKFLLSSVSSLPDLTELLNNEIQTNHPTTQ